MKKGINKKEKIGKVYYDLSNSASFGGKRRLKKIFPTKQVDDWASSQLTYTLHKPLKRRFPTRSYKVGGLNEVWQLDLMEMIPYASINSGYKYILVCIDVFSRFARAMPLKTKSAKEVERTLSHILEQSEYTPKKYSPILEKSFTIKT